MLLFALADDELILGHRHSEWTGWAPHVDHARAWLERLGEGPVTARQRLADGLASALGEALAVFEPIPGEDRLVSDGVLPRSSEELLGEWLATVGSDLEAASLDFVLAEHA